MPIIYETFQVKLNKNNVLINKEDAIKQMNKIITNKIRDGWNPVGDVKLSHIGEVCTSINQSMILRL